MRLEEDLEGATVRARPNRFTVVLTDGRRCHLRDPGRLEELIYPGARILVAPRRGNRKTVCEIFGAYDREVLVLVNSGLHQDLALEALRMDLFPELGQFEKVEREVRLSASRIDLMVDGRAVEIKGCTLVRDGLALFPDAPTERGRRHVMELRRYAESGRRAYVLFLIARPDAEFISPNLGTDPAFSAALYEAFLSGVWIMAFKLRFDGRVIGDYRRVPVILPPPSRGPTWRRGPGRRRP